MSTIGHAQLVALAAGAQFPASEQDTAAAIALAESGGNANAHNAVPPDNSFGLWQINMIGDLGPARRKALQIPDNTALFDPATNADAAYLIWKSAGGKFTPWSTFNNGAYKRHLSGTAPTAGAVTDQQRAGAMAALDKYNAAQKAVLASNPLLEPILTFTDNFRKQGWNVIVILVALVLIVLGVVIIMRRTAGSAVKTAVKLIP